MPPQRQISFARADLAGGHQPVVGLEVGEGADEFAEALAQGDFQWTIAGGNDDVIPFAAHGEGRVSVAVDLCCEGDRAGFRIDRRLIECLEITHERFPVSPVVIVRDHTAFAPDYTSEGIQIWTQDTQFVLTQIEQMNRSQVISPFAGHLDTSRIGVFGMSFGGATAAQVCAIDSRCKAAINMDGFQFGTLLDNPLKVPFMMMQSENQAGTNDFVLDTMTGGGIRLVVRDTQHFNYTDFNLLSPVFQNLRVLGNIDPQRMEHIINTYTLAFFDQTLKGISSPLLQGANPDYPEVELKVFAALSP